MNFYNLLNLSSMKKIFLAVLIGNFICLSGYFLIIRKNNLILRQQQNAEAKLNNDITDLRQRLNQYNSAKMINKTAVLTNSKFIESTAVINNVVNLAKIHKLILRNVEQLNENTIKFVAIGNYAQFVQIFTDLSQRYYNLNFNQILMEKISARQGYVKCQVLLNFN